MKRKRKRKAPKKFNKVAVEVKDIEVYLREFCEDCFRYQVGEINGTDLGLSQVYCAIKIRKLFK